MKVEDGGKRYLVTLKKDVFTGNGCHIDARDVVYTYNWLRNPENGSPSSGVLRVVEDVRMRDDYTVEFILKDTYAPFPVMALTLNLVPSPERCPWSEGELPPFSGAYVLVERKKGERILLKRNPRFDDGKERPECVEFLVVENDISRVLYLLRGEADYAVNAVPPDYIDYLRRRGLQVLSGPGSVYTYLALNLRHPVLRHRRVRTAIAYAIDRDSIIRYLLHGYAEKADAVFPRSHPLYPENVLRYSYNPSKAKELLDRAGFPIREEKYRFVLEYKTSLSKLRVRIAQMIRKYLEDVGIGVRIRQLEWGTLFSDVVKGNFDVYSMDWVGLVDGDVLFYLFHSASVPPDGANRVGYSNPAVVVLLEEARYTLDPVRRIQLYQKVQAILSQDLPYISLWHWKRVLILNPRVVGAKPHPLGDYMNFTGVRLKR